MSDAIRLAAVAPWNEGTPAIHGPALTAASAGKPFLYTIPATGERPMTFSVEALPSGLVADSTTGQITGTVADAGEYRVLLQVQNRHGRAEKVFDIVIGRGLTLTPPMGWNSWNAWRRWIDDAKVRAATDAMIHSGLAARGYTYINIDSCWQGQRGGKHFAIQPNRKFPDMRALSDYIHRCGLKFGIYSTPWVCPWGCTGAEAAAEWGGGELIGCSAGDPDPDHVCIHPNDHAKYVGKDKYEANDVAQWIDWNVDYLKYDWTPTDPASTERMGRCLHAAPRDIVFSLCTGAEIEHVATYKKWANLWRGARDTQDTWNNILATGFYAEEVHRQENWRPHISPGNWYDLDMLALGPQFHTQTSTTSCKLTADEQITHMSYWALFPSPIFLSCNLVELDDFTLRLFCNEEIIAINQDRLASPAVRVKELLQTSLTSSHRLHDYRIHARRLADDTLAVGFFNLADHADELSITLNELQISGSVAVRNVWERRDLDPTNDRIVLHVPSHGSQIVTLRPR
jgi:alpha-galactosidase